LFASLTAYVSLRRQQKHPRRPLATGNLGDRRITTTISRRQSLNLVVVILFIFRASYGALVFVLSNPGRCRHSMAAANSPVLLCNYHLVPEFTWPMHEPSESWLDICDIAAPQVFNRVNLDTAAMADYKSCDKT
jgi:hypothetical protein